MISKRVKRNNRQQRRGKPQRMQINNHRMGEITYSLPKSRLVVPDALITNLSWTDAAHYVINQAGLTYASVRFRPTGLFDIDPTIGGTSIPGFNELSSLYGRYRTLSSSITVDGVNLETFPVNFFIWPSNFDLGANYGSVASALAQPYVKRVTLSPQYGIDHQKLRSGELTSGQIVGTDECYYDETYSSNTNTVPTNNWYWNIGIWSPANNLSNGIQTLIEIKMTVEFTERLTIVS